MHKAGHLSERFTDVEMMEHRRNIFEQVIHRLIKVRKEIQASAEELHKRDKQGRVIHLAKLNATQECINTILELSASTSDVEVINTRGD